MTTRLDDSVVITGNLTVQGSRLPAILRSELKQEDLAVYPIPFANFRVHDNLGSVLPGTSSSDDLGWYSGTYGTDVPFVRSADLKTAGATTVRARVKVQLPPEYVAGETVTIKANAGMITTVADTSCTIDIEAWRIDEDGTLGASDLCATAAQSINSLTFADYSFTITPTTLGPGDELDVRVSIACNDAASGTAVIAALAKLSLCCDIKG